MQPIKSTESTSSGFESQHKLCFIPRVFKILYRELYQKSNYFAKNILNFGSVCFRDNPTIKSNELTSSGLKSQHKLCFLIFFYERLYQSTFFFVHRNQLCPMSILSHTGCADTGHSWLVVIYLLLSSHFVIIFSTNDFVEGKSFIWCVRFFLKTSQSHDSDNCTILISGILKPPNHSKFAVELNYNDISLERVFGPKCVF